MISTATKTLQANNKMIYVALLSTLTFFLFFRLYSRIGSMVGLGNSSGCFVPRTYFCIDLRTSAS